MESLTEPFYLLPSAPTNPPSYRQLLRLCRFNCMGVDLRSGRGIRTTKLTGDRCDGHTFGDIQGCVGMTQAMQMNRRQIIFVDKLPEHLVNESGCMGAPVLVVKILPDSFHSSCKSRRCSDCQARIIFNARITVCDTLMTRFEEEFFVLSTKIPRSAR